MVSDRSTAGIGKLLSHMVGLRRISPAFFSVSNQKKLVDRRFYTV